MKKYGIIITETEARLSGPGLINTTLFAVEDAEGNYYDYRITDGIGEDGDFYKKLFNSDEEASEFVQKNLIEQIEFDNSDEEFPESIDYCSYEIVEIEFDENDEDFKADLKDYNLFDYYCDCCGGWSDEVVCKYDKVEYEVLDIETREALEKFDNYDDAYDFQEEHDTDTIKVNWYKDNKLEYSREIY